MAQAMLMPKASPTSIYSTIVLRYKATQPYSLAKPYSVAKRYFGNDADAKVPLQPASESTALVCLSEDSNIHLNCSYLLDWLQRNDSVVSLAIPVCTKDLNVNVKFDIPVLVTTEIDRTQR